MSGMRLIHISIFVVLNTFTLCSQDYTLLSDHSISSKKNASSIDASLFSIGYSLSRTLSDKQTFGFAISLGLEYGNFFPFENTYQEEVNRQLFSVLVVDFNLNRTLSKTIQIEYGINYHAAINDVPRLDGAASGHFYGLYINPWFGDKIKLGLRLSLGIAHIDGGDYPSYNSLGIYTTYLTFKFPLKG